MSKLVSVIIPTYNRASLVLEAVESVLRSTFKDFELIVVDDGSTDHTARLLIERGFHPYTPARDADRILVSLPHGGFPGRARNEGARVARGTYLAFLDSDDLWLPQKLQVQLSAHWEAEASGKRFRVSHTRETWIRSGKIVSQRKQRHCREGDVFADALKKCVLGPSTVLIERDLFWELRGFREDLQIAEDYELWVRVTAVVPVLYVPQPLTIKRGGHPDQLSQRHPYIEPFRLQALKTLVESGYFNGNPFRYRQALAELARKCRIHAGGCAKRGKEGEASYWYSISTEYEKVLKESSNLA